MSTPLISIILPVYNVEESLGNCLDSILRQTYTNWECVLIDDGSVDNTGLICDKYAEKEPRIRVLHKPNGGVSSARNIGLDNAKGKYICFCDGDDWVDLNWLEGFCSHFNDELIVQGFKYKQTNNKRWQEIKHKEQKLEVPDAVNYLHKQGNSGYLWSRCFKRSIIERNNLRFNKKYKLREDADFIFRYITYISHISITRSTSYNYSMPDSFDKKYNSIDLESDILCTFSIIQSLITVLSSSSKVSIVQDEIGRQLGNMFKLIHDNYYRKYFKIHRPLMDQLLVLSGYKPKGFKITIKYIIYKTYASLQDINSKKQWLTY